MRELVVPVLRNSSAGKMDAEMGEKERREKTDRAFSSQARKHPEPFSSTILISLAAIGYYCTCDHAMRRHCCSLERYVNSRAQSRVWFSNCLCKRLRRGGIRSYGKQAKIPR